MMGVSAGRAIVIGGSLSGLFAALLLRKHGWNVDIYERAGRELTGRGAGIVTHQPLWDALDEIGIAWRSNLGVDVRTRRMFGQDGRLLAELECPQTMTAWDRMYDLLRQAFPAAHYHLGKELVEIRQDAREVSVRFADGTRRSGDILIGCDGIRSRVRAHFLPDVVPSYAGYVAWRALIAESAFPPSLHKQIFSHLAFCLPPGEQMLGYPVAGPNNDLRPGHRRYNLVWYRPADRHTTLRRLLTDDRGVEHAISIPPPAVSRSAIAEMREASERVLAPQFRDCWRIAVQGTESLRSPIAVQRTASLRAPMADAPFLQAIYDVQSPWLAFGRVTMIGDASYVARPHCGAGVTKAADDAMALVDALSMSPTVAEALQRYEALRVPFGCHVVGYARQLGSYLQAQLKTPQERDAAERHFSPEAVLRETATTAFMAA